MQCYTTLVSLCTTLSVDQDVLVPSKVIINKGLWLQYWNVITCFALQVGAEVNISNDDLMSQTDIVKFFTKEKTRHHFVVLLVEEFIDETTQLKSNVRGKGERKTWSSYNWV